MLRRKKIGQSTAEYAIVIGLVIAAAVAMQIYVKRGIQAKVKGATDFVPKGAENLLSGRQYEPYYATSELDNESSYKGNIEVNPGGEVVRSMTGEDEGEVRKKSGTITTVALESAKK